MGLAAASPSGGALQRNHVELIDRTTRQLAALDLTLQVRVLQGGELPLSGSIRPLEVSTERG